MLVGFIAIPYLIFTEAWDILAVLFHQHPVWFTLLLIPVVYLATKLWKWLYEMLGAAMMGIGSIVDRLDKDQR